ncbi:magnesium transporter [Psychrosphaera sp. B3R10]|uniref:Magnesium transporter MgtE n=1 Tax=Psychrosphaera algicola TaxID=3023714 RepID=A0ABT5FGW8_9GAMM|nr:MULTISPECIES: magnesium transporter [unclassified Psychrosphaera]MBU2881917.1 magnesium transporter [Psychrosphaera sp. I2R16]MBU2991228.1 magnesium transporter [Psychrosphaera sp. B3R10]MDC2890488.1 magnesium transporter [Psychrosphaera sp. G1-22]MDO6721006.1 magnesium transporter [Psychrosphaera sp. 1_MG-2023]
MAELLEQEYNIPIEELNTALSGGMFVHVRNMLDSMPTSDIALLLHSSPPKSRTVIWQLIDSSIQGEVLEELSEDVRNPILRSMTPEKVAEAAGNLDDDDFAEVLRGMPDTIYRKVLKSMDKRDRKRAERVLSYEEDTAGALMNTDTITVRPDVTVDVILRYLRLKGALPEATDYLYVVDKDEKFIGEVSLAALLTSQPVSLISEVMETDFEVIPATMEETEVASLFERYDWISAPVIDENGLLLGRITIDDIVDVIRENAAHSMLSMAGLDDEADTFAPIVKSTQRRSLWLGVNLFTALLAAFVSSLFESTLDELAFLAVLNTIVPSMGGVAGSQTLTLVIRGMAVGHVTQANQRWLMGKELAIGFYNGLIWAVLIAGVVALWKQDLMLGAVIAFAMMMNLIAAGLSGVFIPLMLKRMNIDPALAGSVILTTVTDIVGIFTFLGTATWLLI